MHSWYGQPEAKRARGAGTWDLVRWATGSHAGHPSSGVGRWGSRGSLITLGDSSLPKSRCWGVDWNVEDVDSWGCMLEDVRNKGLQVGLGARVGVLAGGKGKTTLGSAGVSTLGYARAGRQVGRRDRGKRRHHDSKMSWRLAIASSWEKLVGGGAPWRAPAMPCKPWMIQSSVEGAKTERYYVETRLYPRWLGSWCLHWPAWSNSRSQGHGQCRNLALHGNPRNVEWPASHGWGCNNQMGWAVSCWSQRDLGKIPMYWSLG